MTRKDKDSSSLDLSSAHYYGILRQRLDDDKVTPILTRKMQPQRHNNKWLTCCAQTTAVVLLCLAPSAQAFAPGVHTWKQAQGTTTGTGATQPAAVVARRPKSAAVRPNDASGITGATSPSTLGSAGPWRLWASLFDPEQDDDDDEGRMRKRDRIKDWFSSSSSSSSSSGISSDSDDDSRSRIKAKFGDLLSGMPSLSEMLAEQPDDDEQNDGNSNPVRKSQEKDPAWFEQEKKRIMDR